MANSLMELYGGGMVGKSNNYQLGGQIARSRRGREYQVELADLKRKAERDADRRGFLGKVGSFAKLAGNLVLPGVGDILGTAVESTYKPRDYSGGKYAQDIRDDLTQQSEDFKSSVFERGVVGGLQTALMPEVYSGIKEELGKGVDYLKGLRGPEASAIEQGSGLYQGAGLMGGNLMSPERAIPDRVGSLEAPSFAPGFGQSASPFKLDAGDMLSGGKFPAVQGAGKLSASAAKSLQDRAASFIDPSSYTPFSDMILESISETPLGDFTSSGMSSQFPSSNNLAAQAGYYGPYFNRQGGMIPKYPHGGPVHTNMSAEALAKMQQQQALPAAQQTSTVSNYASSAVSPMSTQTTPTMGGIDTEALSGLSASGFNMGDFLGGAVLGDGSGINLGLETLPTTTTTDATDTTSVTDPSGTYSGYGTAIDPIAALGQMGMGNIASDPRLQKYLKDLPQFGMGYQQQFGDVQAGGRQALSQMYAAQRNMGGGFAGAGAGAQAFGQQYSGLLGEQARKRRGVVEGFQSDLLSSIRDIEEKGDFTFGQGEGGKTQDELKIQDLIDQGYTQEEAERQIYQDTAAGETYSG